MEAEFAIDDRTALNLYDCLIPKIREQRKFIFQKEEKFSIEDFKSQLKVKTLTYELEKQ